MGVDLRLLIVSSVHDPKEWLAFSAVEVERDSLLFENFKKSNRFQLQDLPKGASVRSYLGTDGAWCGKSKDPYGNRLTWAEPMQVHFAMQRHLSSGEEVMGYRAWLLALSHFMANMPQTFRIVLWWH